MVLIIRVVISITKIVLDFQWWKGCIYCAWSVERFIRVCTL